MAAVISMDGTGVADPLERSAMLIGGRLLFRAQSGRDFRDRLTRPTIRVSHMSLMPIPPTSDAAGRPARQAPLSVEWATLSADRGNALLRLRTHPRQNHDSLLRAREPRSGKPVVRHQSQDLPAVTGQTPYVLRPGGLTRSRTGHSGPPRRVDLSVREPFGRRWRDHLPELPLMIGMWKIAVQPATRGGCTVVLKNPRDSHPHGL